MKTRDSFFSLVLKEENENFPTQSQDGRLANRNSAVIPNQAIGSERKDIMQSLIKESVFHVDQSNKYPSHDDDFITFQVHLKILTPCIE